MTKPTVFPHVPQFFESDVRSGQAPSQSGLVLFVHTQAPNWQVEPEGHYTEVSIYKALLHDKTYCISTCPTVFGIRCKIWTGSITKWLATCAYTASWLTGR